jgi:hypothetical protein
MGRLSRTVRAVIATSIPFEFQLILVFVPKTEGLLHFLWNKHFLHDICGGPLQPAPVNSSAGGAAAFAADYFRSIRPFNPLNAFLTSQIKTTFAFVKSSSG